MRRTCYFWIFPKISQRICGSKDNEKKQAKYDLNAERKLGIADTKFNNNNKIIARAISTNSRKLCTIAKKQYATKGSVPIDQIIKKRCYIDHNQSIKYALH